MMMVPYCDLRLQHARLAPEINAAFTRVMETSAFILGPEVAAFEQAFAAYIGTAHAIGTSSGATALVIALKALGIQAGDEVLVPAMTFFATGEAVAFLGATPVFVDVDPVTFAIDTGKIPAHITSRTRAILAVHLYGQPADASTLRSIGAQYGLKVMGDCAHAHGAQFAGTKVGAWEDIAAFSFYPSKNLGCPGEAGIITTNDETLATRCKSFRDHGSVKKFEHTCIGTNARMSALQAAILGVKLPHLNEWNEQRRSIARTYSRELAGLLATVPQEQSGSTHVYHVYQVQIRDRARIMRALADKGIATTIHYPVPMHLHEGFRYLGYHAGAFPVAEALASSTLSLPCFPGMSQDQQQYVIDAVRAIA